MAPASPEIDSKMTKMQMPAHLNPTDFNGSDEISQAPSLCGSSNKPTSSQAEFTCNLHGVSSKLKSLTQEIRIYVAKFCTIFSRNDFNLVHLRLYLESILFDRAKFSKLLKYLAKEAKNKDRESIRGK